MYESFNFNIGRNINYNRNPVLSGEIQRSMRRKRWDSIKLYILTSLGTGEIDDI